MNSVCLVFNISNAKYSQARPHCYHDPASWVHRLRGVITPPMTFAIKQISNDHLHTLYADNDSF